VCEALRGKVMRMGYAGSDMAGNGQVMRG
jgi:hypothetical protein